MVRTNKEREQALSKACVKAGYTDVENIRVLPRSDRGYVEVRIDSEQLYAAGATDASVVRNVLKFAEPGIAGVYAKAIIQRSGKGKKNEIRRRGVIGHIPM